jgi:hypothetical protein
MKRYKTFSAKVESMITFGPYIFLKSSSEKNGHFATTISVARIAKKSV